MISPNRAEARTLRFFEVDLDARELRKRGVRMKLQDHFAKATKRLRAKVGACHRLSH
jgi:hypothetical protein